MRLDVEARTLVRKNDNIDSTLFTFQSIKRNSPESIFGLKCLHKNIQGIVSNESNPDGAIESLNEEIHANKYINALNKYGYKVLLTKEIYKEIDKKSDMFFDFLSRLPEEEKKIFIRDDYFTISAFLVAIGVKPSCIISNEMSRILKKGELFKNAEYMKYGSKHLKLMHVFYPKKILNVINNNNDIFPQINGENKLSEYLENNPVIMHTTGMKHRDGGAFYLEQLRTGILLGIPKTEAIKFAAYQPYINDFIGYLFYGSFNGILQEPNDLKEFEMLKKDRTHRLKQYNKIPLQVINILAQMGTVRVDEDIHEFAYYRFGFEPINGFYTKSIRQILSHTEYHKKIKQLNNKK